MAQAYETSQGNGVVSLTCPHGGGRAIARALRLNRNAEVGRIGRSCRATGGFPGTEPLLVDLCGTVLRFFVKGPQRKWTP